MKSIEIIIPVQNMASLLDDALAPLLKQMGSGDRLTVVNDASSDDTEESARRLGADVISVKRSRGPYFARQLAAERSQADILLFIDGRCRALPGLVEAHREMHGKAGVALSCTDVHTRSGPSLAARVAAMRQSMSLRTQVDVDGRPPYFTTANLGVSRTAFNAVGGFREMRSGADADLCWRIQDSRLGSMAVDRRVLIELEPRDSVRDLLSQVNRYGKSTAYLEWMYGDLSPSKFDAKMPFYKRVWTRISDRKDAQKGSKFENLTNAVVLSSYAIGYYTAKRRADEFVQPQPYDIDSCD